jgi:SAM-dependent methyltransferase
MAETPYDARFQEFIKDDSFRSAERVVPLLLSLIRPRAVVDVGCGTGAWLAVFQQHGAERILGIDGDYVDRTTLLIPPDRFLGRDIGRPLALGERFDLVMSLEVAEHVPASHAGAYIDNLTSLGDVIVFSAAIPNQGGVGHVNEQWPEYWKTLFDARGYIVVDCLRRRIWNDTSIERWYRQNMLLYVKSSALDAHDHLRAEYGECRHQILSIVHPETFFPLSLPQLVRSVPGSLRRAYRRVTRGMKTRQSDGK